MTFMGFLIAVLVGVDLAIFTVLILQHYGVIGPLNLPGT